MKCLIVDDEVFCREFVATLLRSTADCHHASNGNEALAMYNSALAAEAPFNVIIMDIMMPGMSGHDAVLAIRLIEKDRNLAKRVNIIMLTALNSATEAMEAFCTAHSAAYLVKPVSKVAFFNVLAKLGLLRG